MRSRTPQGPRWQLREYLNSNLRNRRFDPIVQRAIRTGEPIPAATRDKIVTTYENNVLRYRGQNIARTEMLGALHSGREEALTQMMERERLPTEAVEQTWDAVNDNDTRDSHDSMEGQKRQKGQPFVTGRGQLLLYPGDRSMGADAAEIINCRCSLRTRVDWTHILEG